MEVKLLDYLPSLIQRKQFILSGRGKRAREAEEFLDVRRDTRTEVRMAICGHKRL